MNYFTFILKIWNYEKCIELSKVLITCVIPKMYKFVFSLENTCMHDVFSLKFFMILELDARIEQG